MAPLGFLSIIGLSLLIISLDAKYMYLPNRGMPGSAVIYQSGNTHFSSLTTQCDALGLQCAGFDTYGNLYNSVLNASQTNALSMFVKTPGVLPPPLPNLVPLPQQYSFGDQVLPVSAQFYFQSNIQSTILEGAFERYSKLIFNQGNVTVPSGLSAISVMVASNNDTLQMGIDESYSISIASATSAMLKANTIYGAMRGLETLSQLINYNFDSAQYEIVGSPVDINDYPEFEHRGIMIDVSRHFIPVAEIRKVIDSLSYAKFNVLHLHLSDCQSFPMESKTYPDLWQGSYSARERYTQAQMTDLVDYAKQRGIRVVPEVDGPGHMYSLGIGYPELLPANYAQSTSCYNVCPNNPCDVPIDPSNNMTYTILDAFMGEITGGAPRSGIFFDDFMHLGGDEVEYGCWNESLQIQQFMSANKLNTFDDLYMYFVQKYHQIAVSYGRIPINWEEVFNHFGNKLPMDTIIHVWLNHNTLVNVTQSGYRGILSNYNDWYLDHLNTDWTVFYLNDPYQGISPANKHLVIGGEACMWGETVDISDQIQRIWPRSAAVAERLWSYYPANQADGIELAIPRFQDFRCRLTDRGIATAPLFSPYPNSPSSCYNM